MKINRRNATFQDKHLEKAYLEDEVRSVLKYARPAVLALGFLFFIFLIPDYLLNQSQEVIRNIFFVRLFFLMLIIVLFYLLKYQRFYINLTRWVLLYAFIASGCYLLIYYLYETPNFFMQSLGVVALILAFFNVVNDWIGTVLISLLLCCGFIVVTIIRPENVLPSSFSGVIVYFLIVIIVSSISAYRIHTYKRKQYIDRINLERLSEKDALTGIYNRGKLDKELKRWVELACRYDHSLALIMFDLDNLKEINDEYGHLIGDNVIKELTAIIGGMLRSSDVFARWGGDEFIILLPYAERDMALDLAERIRDLVSSNSFQYIRSLSCSFGVAVYEKGDDVMSLVRKADSSLYSAKQKGKNLVECY